MRWTSPGPGGTRPLEDEGYGRFEGGVLVPGGVWSLQGGGFGRLAGGVLESGGAWSLEGGGLVPGEAPGPGSQEGE